MEKGLSGNTYPLDSDGIVMDSAAVERYLKDLESKGRSVETIGKYSYALDLLYQALSDNKLIQRGTLGAVRDQLLQKGYSTSSVNVVLSAADSFLSFMGHRELQIGERCAGRNDDSLQPELSRNEYLRILTAAKDSEDEKLYFVIKTIACTGIFLRELPEVTVENVKAGKFQGTTQESRRIVRIPRCLQKELLDYAGRHGIETGMIFRGGRGKSLNRSYITSMITKLCIMAQVPEKKGNPRCLRRLYLSTCESIRNNMEVLIEQALERQIEEEQLTVGWDN